MNNFILKTSGNSNLISPSIMYSSKLLPFGVLLILATPLSSFAQMKTTSISSGSDSEIIRNSSGTETINQRISKSSQMEGVMGNQTMSMTMSGQGMEGATTELMLQSMEQMRSEDMAVMEQLSMAVSEENILDGIMNSDLVADDNFSITATMTMNESMADMYTDTNEETNILRVDNFESTTTTEAWTTETGFISSFDM
jgi:hypothetical protein